jgi:hypothetical protein
MEIAEKDSRPPRGKPAFQHPPRGRKISAISIISAISAQNAQADPDAVPRHRLCEASLTVARGGTQAEVAGPTDKPLAPPSRIWPMTASPLRWPNRESLLGCVVASDIFNTAVERGRERPRSRMLVRKDLLNSCFRHIDTRDSAALRALVLPPC